MYVARGGNAVQGNKLERALDLAESADEPSVRQAMRQHLQRISDRSAPAPSPQELLRLRLASGCADEAAGAALEAAATLQASGDYKVHCRGINVSTR